jgi:acyl carrier protein
MNDVGGTNGQVLDDRITGLVRDVLQIEVASRDDDLLADGMLDSLGIVTLIAELEGALGYELMLDEFDIEDFRTVGSIAAFVTASRSATEGVA